MAATPNYLDILGARPHRGRFFTPEDAREGGRAAILSYESWKKRFGGREDIVGRPLVVGAKTFDVIGILPPKLMLPAFFGTKPEIVTATAPPARGEKGGSFYPIVRRNPGLAREQVQPRIDAVTQAISARNPRTVNVGPSLQEVRSVMFPVGRPIMKWLFAASSLVLLIGCANLANMLLARSHRNQRATGLAIALGATRMRVIRPLLFESAIIGVAGAAIALVVTSIAFDALLKQVPRGAYGPAPVGVDLRVSLMALGAGLLAGVLFAAVPAWRSSRRDVQALLQNRRAIGRGRSRFGSPMVAVQVALAVMLIFGAAVTTRAFVTVLQIPLGFDDRNVIRLSV
jgi:putative ABC transport system permease protein